MIIGQVIAGIGLVDNLNHAGDRINLGAGNVNGRRRDDGRQPIDRARGLTCRFIEACPKLIPVPSSHALPPSRAPLPWPSITHVSHGKKLLQRL